MSTIANDYRALISGFSWNAAGVIGRPITVTYSFETAADPGLGAAARASFEPFSEADKTLTLAALKQWDDASGLEFVMVESGAGQIRFSKYNLAIMNIRGSGAGNYPSPTGSAFAGDVWINTAEGQAAFGVTNYLGVTPMLILHEIGHALGLKHPWEGDLTFDPADQPPTAMIGRVDGVISAVDRDAITYLYGPRQDALDQAGDVYNNRLEGATFGDTLHGMAGNDTINGGAGRNYLRGDEGDDTVSGGADFDDINGNMGADSAAGGPGDDWVVGGKDRDLLYGETGADIVYGNLGEDTCDGGDGDDLVRGGQQNDILFGGGGNDWLSGDRDTDTLIGGAGADTFNFFAEAGQDRVTDFNAAEGDRVRIEGRETYAATQVGADMVITVGAAQLTLVGVQLSSLPVGWIYVG